MNVKPYAHPEPEKVHLTYVWHGHGMQFERFYTLNQSIVAWFAHLNEVGFHPFLTNLGKHLWWLQCECEYAHPQSEKVLKYLIYV
jgi:hypothetical protein